MAQHGRDPSLPDFAEVVDALVAATWGGRGPDAPGHAPVLRAEQRLVADRLIGLAGDEEAMPEVRAIASESLRRLAEALAEGPDRGVEAAHRRAVRDEIRRFLDRPAATRRPTPPLPAPPGDPIGQPGRGPSAGPP